jgi:hypothetical protein
MRNAMAEALSMAKAKLAAKIFLAGHTMAKRLQ